MRTDYIEFDTPYGPAYVVYNIPERWKISNGETHPTTVSQVLVQCPNNIIWDDSTGKWWPEPYVIDHVLPRARMVAEVIGVPAYEWIRSIRRDSIWAIERDFMLHQPVSAMMDFYYENDYDGTHSHKVSF